MLSSFNISLSGIQSAIKFLGVSANNVANSNTDGFKKDVASMSEGSNGGVTVSIEKSSEPGPVYKTKEGEIVEASNVDYAEEAVNQIVADHYLKANVAALKTANEMEGSFLDIFAWKEPFFPKSLLSPYSSHLTH